MPRRRRNPKDPPDSTHWSSYKPTDARYWTYGGPWVPPDQIPPDPSVKPESIRPYEKPETRARSVVKLRDELEAKLPEVVTYYTELGKHGPAALKWGWEREEIAQGDSDPAQPNGYHQGLRWAYHDIAHGKACLVVYEQILDGLTSGQMPLFARPK